MGAGPTGLLLAAEPQRRMSVESAPDGDLVDAAIAISVDDDGRGVRLDEPAAAEPGIGGLTLLVVCRDGHLGHRADHDHVTAPAGFQSQLVAPAG
jgi:hypothetical protein